jgi:hypothetical protein
MSKITGPRDYKKMSQGAEVLQTPDHKQKNLGKSQKLNV